MANTRKDRFETYATKAIKAMQKSLSEDGVTEAQALVILKLISINLEKSLKLDSLINDKPTK